MMSEPNTCNRCGKPLGDDTSDLCEDCLDEFHDAMEKDD